MDDVSGEKGVACDGDGCGGATPDPKKIDRLEFNTSFGHYSNIAPYPIFCTDAEMFPFVAWYKSRDNRIVDLNDKVVGSCQPIPLGDGSSFSCAERPPKVESTTYFRCDSDIMP